MLLGRNESPFPENPHCKRCASKNCRELLVQPLFPGKVIFVHRRHFCSIPDFIPSWRDEENATPAQEVALTDDLEIVSGPVTVKNPRWEHKKNEEKDKVEVEIEKLKDTASFGNTITLMVDVTGMPEGSGITFDIYETSKTPPMCVASTKGKIENGIGKGDWVITDKSGLGNESKLAFEGVAKSKASVRCEIPLVVVKPWGVCCGTDTLPLALQKFAVYKNDEVVYMGITDDEGTIRVPFEHTDEYQFCLLKK
jgi:hypothetical protein